MAGPNPIRPITICRRARLQPGQTVAVTQRLFAGAKVVDTLRAYEHDLGIERFDLAVDWGWFPFLTQPLFWLLDKLYRYFGNFGIAIIMRDGA